MSWAGVQNSTDQNSLVSCAMNRKVLVRVTVTSLKLTVPVHMRGGEKYRVLYLAVC